jgi:hypothetical protein
MMEKLIAAHVPDFSPRNVPLNFRALHTVSVEDLEAIYRAVGRKGVEARAGGGVTRAPLAAPVTVPERLMPESLESTTWRMTRDDGISAVWEFCEGGKLEEYRKPHVNVGRWAQDVKDIHFMFGLFNRTMYKGTISGNTMTGTYEDHGAKGATGTWKAAYRGKTIS